MADNPDDEEDTGLYAQVDDKRIEVRFYIDCFGVSVDRQTIAFLVNIASWIFYL